MIRETTEGVEIDVRVVPRARKTELSGTRDGALLVRLTAPPSDNAANTALIRFLSQLLHLPPSAIKIVSGEKHRRKRVRIVGLTAQALLSQTLRILRPLR